MFAGCGLSFCNFPVAGAFPAAVPSTSRADEVEVIELSSDSESDGETLASTSRSTARKQSVVLSRGVEFLPAPKKKAKMPKDLEDFVVKDEPGCSSSCDDGLESAERERSVIRARLRDEGLTAGDLLDSPVLVGT